MSHFVRVISFCVFIGVCMSACSRSESPTATRETTGAPAAQPSGGAPASAASQAPKGKTGKAAFKAANKLTTLSGQGYAFGNNDSAKQLAKQFADALKLAEKENFSGGKKFRLVSLTNGQFLTYCQLHDDSALFLVHVPQFKRYKGEVRDALLTLSWDVASKVLEKHSAGKPLQIGIGLRGSMLYGGSAIGKRGQQPELQNAFSIKKEPLYSFFK